MPGSVAVQRWRLRLGIDSGCCENSRVQPTDWGGRRSPLRNPEMVRLTRFSDTVFRSGFSVRVFGPGFAAAVTLYEVDTPGMDGNEGLVDTLNGPQAVSAMKFTSLRSRLL
jgi:hypothetical protein